MQSILCFFMFKGILDSFKSFEQDPIAVYIAVAINIAIMGYAAFLKVRLFPFQNFFNTRKDENGIFIYQNNLTKVSLRQAKSKVLGWGKPRKPIIVTQLEESFFSNPA